MDQPPEQETDSQTYPYSGLDTAIESVFKDIFAFSLTPLKKDWLPTAYEQMGIRASPGKVVGLAVSGVCSMWLTLAFLALSSPFSDFWYMPALLALLLLLASTFLAHLFVGNWAFRALRGKGSLIAQSYLQALSAVNVMLLYWIGLVLQILLYRFVGPAVLVQLWHLAACICSRPGCTPCNLSTICQRGV